jgi:hypothetical protein
LPRRRHHLPSSIPASELATASSPAPEHAAASTLASEHAAVILFLKLLVIVALPLSTSALPPSEYAATAVDLDPASL